MSHQGVCARVCVCARAHASNDDNSFRHFRELNRETKTATELVSIFSIKPEEKKIPGRKELFPAISGVCRIYLRTRDRINSARSNKHLYNT